jgi:hypothetical protein
MAMKQRERTPRRAGEEAGTPADESALRHGGVRKGDTSRRYSVAGKLALVEELVQGARPSMSSAFDMRASVATLPVVRVDSAANAREQRDVDRQRSIS